MSDLRWWRVLRVILLVLAIANHVWVSAVTGTINEDETYSMGEAVNAVQGRGFTLPSIVSPDPANITYLHTVKFAAGLALAYAGLLEMSIRPGMADFLLDCLAGILFFIIWFFILEMLGERISVRVRLFVWLFWLAFPAPLFAGQMTGHTADILAVAFFSGSLFMLLLGLKNPQRLLWYSGLGGLLSGLAALMKTVYWPLLAVAPLALGGLALLRWPAWRRLFWAAVVNTLVAGLFLAGQMAEARAATGHFSGYTLTLTNRLTTRMIPLDTPQWDRIRRATPTPAFALGLSPVSFYGGRNLKSFPIRLAGDAYSWWYSGLVLLALVTVYPRALWNFRKDADGASSSFLFVFGLVAVVWALGWQVWLSAAYEAQGTTTPWIPLNDTRYISTLFPFLLLGVAMAFFAPWQARTRWVQWIGMTAMVLVLVYPAYIAATSRANIITRQLSVGAFLRAEATFATRVRGLQSAIAESGPDGPPVVVLFPDSDRDFADIRPMLFLSGTPGLIVPDGPLQTSRPVRIILIVRPEDYHRYAGRVGQYGGSCATHRDFTYCVFALEPDR